MSSHTVQTRQLQPGSLFVLRRAESNEQYLIPCSSAPLGAGQEVFYLVPCSTQSLSSMAVPRRVSAPSTRRVSFAASRRATQQYTRRAPATQQFDTAMEAVPLTVVVLSRNEEFPFPNTIEIFENQKFVGRDGLKTNLVRTLKFTGSGVDHSCQVFLTRISDEGVEVSQSALTKHQKNTGLELVVDLTAKDISYKRAGWPRRQNVNLDHASGRFEYGFRIVFPSKRAVDATQTFKYERLHTSRQAKAMSCYSNKRSSSSSACGLHVLGEAAQQASSQLTTPSTLPSGSTGRSVVPQTTDTGGEPQSEPTSDGSSSMAPTPQEVPS